MSRRRSTLAQRWLQLAGVAGALLMLGCAIEAGARTWMWLVAR